MLIYSYSDDDDDHDDHDVDDDYDTCIAPSYITKNEIVSNNNICYVYSLSNNVTYAFEFNISRQLSES